MTKATDLPPLVARLLEIKKMAPISKNPSLADANGREISVGNLKCFFYEAWRLTAQGKPNGLVEHLNVYEAGQTIFMASLDLGKLETARFTKWKRGAWEQMIVNTPPSIPQESETVAQYIARMARRGVAVTLRGADPSETIEAYKARTSSVVH